MDSAPACAQPLYAHPLFQKLTKGAWRPGGLELTRHGLKLCAFTAGERVADVGCGGGATLECMQALGLQAVGLDTKTPHSSAPTVCADAAHLPLMAHCLDGIVCECVLSLLPDTENVLAGFARVVRPSGVLLLSDLFLHDIVANSSRHAKQSCLDGALARQELEDALEKTGFCIRCFEDHSALLRPLAAQLLWHGLSCAGQGGTAVGYGLWIAQKRPFS